MLTGKFSGKLKEVGIRGDTMQKLGEFIYLNRKWVLTVWSLVIILSILFTLRLPAVLSGNGFEYNGEYNATRTILEKDFHQPKSTIILVFQRNSTITDEKWKAFIEDTLRKIQDTHITKNSVSPLGTRTMVKHDIAYGLLNFEKKPESLGNEITALKSVLKDTNGIKVTMTGEPIIVQDLNKASQEDLAKAELIGLPIALIVLILAFGGLVAASIPLIIGVVSILITMGIVYFFSFKTNLTIFILNIIPMIGLALSIDFALLFINRYKEELQKNSIQEAIRVTVATAGKSIIFSALCVFIGLSGLWFIKIDIFQNVALGGMTVVFISACSALFFLPALLSIIGHRINKFSILRIKGKETGMWHQFACFVMKRPVLMILTALIILFTGLIPVKNISLTIPGIDSLPSNYPSRMAYETFNKNFIPKDKTDEKTVTILLQPKGKLLDQNNLNNIKQIIDILSRDQLVRSIDSPFSATGAKDGNQLLQIMKYGNQKMVLPISEHFFGDNKMLIDVYLKTDNSTEARKWVRDWSQKHSSLKTYYGGSIKFEQEIFDEINRKAPYGLLLIFISTFIILMAAFQSLLIPVKAILMNILSLSCTFGIVVWIFQQSHFGIKPADIALILPVFVFTLVFGLSMDYEVFLISRIQEFYLKTGDNSQATVNGLTYTSKIITSAAAIMIVVTGAFAFTGVMPIKQLGSGIAIAIFIDATIVRMVLVPALMKLLGDWNWWLFGFKQKREMKR